MNVQGKHVTVMGLGRFGGGLGVTKWLLKEGAIVLLTDLSSEEELSLQLDDLGTHEHLKLVCGEHRVEDFVNADVVVANPAIPMPWENSFLSAAWDAGVEVTTEIAITIEQLDRSRVIGVTGTSGKSTTTAMIDAALRSSGLKSHLYGNIGGSLLHNISLMRSTDIVVLELSSAMLWWLDKLYGDDSGWSPGIAVLTNIEPNHLDWHGSLEAYIACKQHIFTHQVEGDTALTQDADATFEGLQVLGLHNQRNAAVAFLAAIAIGADAAKARAGIQAFHGLPHRLECVGGVYYNDSKSTTPTATKLAVDAFEDPSKVHLIVGGYDKQIDLSLIAEQANRVACLYAIGATGETIANLAHGKVHSCETLDQAVRAATSSMKDGDVVVMSPGCASWDQFDNYEQRGDTFNSLVTQST